MLRRLCIFALSVLCQLASLVAAAPTGSDAPGAGAGAATEFGDSRDVIKVSVIADRTRVSPGDRLRLAIIFDHAPGWHIQANKSRDPDAMNTTLEAAAAPDGRLVPDTAFIQWPPVKLGKFGGGTIDSEVFDGKAIAFLPVTVPPEAPTGESKLSVTTSFQACDDKVCIYPAHQTFEVAIQIVEPARAASTASIDKSIFGSFDEGVWQRIASGDRGPQLVDFDLFGLKFQINAAGGGFILLLIVAALGGFLLNLTPCVLPLIPIKIISISRTAGSRRRSIALGVAMFIGIVGFFKAIGLAIVLVKQFSAINQLFQYPAFTIGIGAFIVLMAVGMCGVFALRLPSAVYQITPSLESLAGSLAFGIMTAVLSTPCTAPFMGAAAAWATKQPPFTVIAVFAAIGTGMGLPYLVLSIFPRLVDRMPRTGPASELIKQVMGMLMLAAGAYFIGTGLSGLLATPPTPPSRIYWWFVAAFGVMAGLWLAWRTIHITPRITRRIIFSGLGLAIAAISLGVGVSFTDKGPIDWVYYTPQRFAEASGAGKVVVMEFTAEWCLNCKALEQSVLRNPSVVRLLREDKVTPIKVDLTGNNTMGNDMLKRAGRLTIPLLVVYAPDGREVFKSDYYTPDQIVQAVREAQGGPLAQRPGGGS